MIAWFARNHVAANLLMVSIIFLGLFSLKAKIPLEVFPSFESDVVSVNVSLRGATPEDIEQGVTILVEESIADLEGIEKVVSRTTEGSTAVHIEIMDGYDVRQLLADIKSRVDGISNLPPDIDNPVIAISQRKHEVMSVVVAGERTEREIKAYAETVRDALLRLPGVTQVALDGVRDYEISIEISEEKLQQYQLTLEQVANVIAASAMDISAGNIRTSGGDILIRSKGQAYQRQEFENILVRAGKDGSALLLRDIARVDDGFEEVPLKTRFDGKPAASIEVYRIGNESAISVAEAVKGFLVAEKPRLPAGITLSYWDDDSEIVKKRLNTLVTNAIQGGILVFLLLSLFLRPAVAFWVFIGVPISFLGAFMLMPFLGVTLNIISLFGFILVLGIVVDDAIVTGENVYSHLRRAESGLEAAIRGTQEVAVPVTFGVLTTVAAFVPIAFMEGGRGPVFAQISAVVIPVLLFSLIESKFVLPAHLKHVKLLQSGSSGGRFERWQRRFADGFEQGITTYYQPVLRFALRHRYSVLITFVGMLVIIASLLSVGWTRFVFFPKVPSETARASLTMPIGTPFEVTDRYVEKMTQAALHLQEKYRDEETGESVIMHVYSISGSAGGNSHQGRVRFEIVSPEVRKTDVTIRQLVSEWRRLIGVVPGAEQLTYRAEIGRGSDPLDIELRGNDFKALVQAADALKDYLAGYPSVFDISDNFSDGKQELQIELTKQGYALGLNRSSLMQQVRQAFYGIEVQRIQRGRDSLRVMLRLPLQERISTANLESLMVRLPDNNEVPLSHVATLIPGKSPSTIYRIDRYRTVNVQADVNKQQVNMTALQKDLAVYLAELNTRIPSVTFHVKGELEEQQKSFGSLQIGLLGALFVIYGLLAIPFKSYVQPLIVMSVIPFGAIGAIAGHWLMGMNLTIMSVLGIVALVGVVVNDSLVLVDFVNQQRRRQLPLLKSILTAGIARFRPVILTSLTTFLGLLPLLFEKSTQAQFLIPMAVSLAFGILFATLITLIMVPINYMILEDLRGLFSAKNDREADQNPAA